MITDDQPSGDSNSFHVVAVGAHPDDIEIACGGTLAKLVSQGYRVAIIDLTDGEPTPRCEHPSIRLAEAQAAADILGVKRIVLPLPNRRLFDSFEARVMLATELRRLRPSIVIGFGHKTPLASPDHYQAMLITDAAVFYSRLTKWEQYFSNLEPHTVAAQIYFHLAFEPPERSGAAGCITVDISDQLHRKLKAIECYQTQFPPERRHVIDRVEVLAKAAGVAAGFAAGEMFTTTRSLGCQDLFKAIMPGGSPASSSL